jgi:hypothetical protein
MKTENWEKWAISICGLNCAKCDMYEAGHGNQKLRDEIVEWFKKERNETVRQEEIRCEGCRGPLELHWSSDCKMMSCAKKKGFQYCFECGDFPCKILGEFGSDGISHHKRTVENLKRMKRIGLAEWISEQKKEGQCLFCP